MPTLRFQSPELPDLAAVAPYYALSEDAGWFSNSGPCVRLLERRCSDYLGLAPASVTVNNATNGLLVAMRAAFGEVDPRRPYVVVPSFTFVASVAAISWAGWQPLFVDVDPDDWHVATAALQRLAPRASELAGVLMCSTFGVAPSSSRQAEVATAAAELGVPMVVDSAAGFGSVDDTGQRLGGQGLVEVFSFHATKPFAIGEGGLLSSHSEEVLARARSLANFGFDTTRGLPGTIGLNAKLPEIEAAIGLAVLDGFPTVLDARRRAAGWLLDEVAPLGVARQAGSAGGTFQFVPVLMPTPDARTRLLADAIDAGIELRVYFDPAMHDVPAYAAAPRDELTVTAELVSRIVALPMSNSLTDADLERLRDLVVGATRQR